MLAFHPLVLSEFERLLAEHPLTVGGRRLDADLIADPSNLLIPKASVYVLEAHVHRPTTEALVVGVLSRQPTARVVVVAEKFDKATAFPLLRLGAKGLLSFAEATSQLRARSSRSGRGFWARTCFRFVDEHLLGARPLGRSARAIEPSGKGSARGPAREPSNKEIASSLHCRADGQFHVSNLLAKYGVRAAPTSSC